MWTLLISFKKDQYLKICVESYRRQHIFLTFKIFSLPIDWYISKRYILFKNFKKISRIRRCWSLLIFLLNNTGTVLVYVSWQGMNSGEMNLAYRALGQLCAPVVVRGGAEPEWPLRSEHLGKTRSFSFRRFTKKCIRTRHFAESGYGYIQALIKPHPI